MKTLKLTTVLVLATMVSMSFASQMVKSKLGDLDIMAQRGGDKAQDHKFAALLLTKYMSFEYRPVTAIRFVENETAESLLKILLK